MRTQDSGYLRLKAQTEAKVGSLQPCTHVVSTYVYMNLQVSQLRPLPWCIDSGDVFPTLLEAGVSFSLLHVLSHIL